MTIVPVPEAGRPASEGLPLPYGLQVDSVGRVYSTQLAANTLVRYDSRDGSADLWDMPAENSGPRRPGLDPEDRPVGYPNSIRATSHCSIPTLNNSAA